jgi:hypothetical protein
VSVGHGRAIKEAVDIALRLLLAFLVRDRPGLRYRHRHRCETSLGGQPPNQPDPCQQRHGAQQLEDAHTADFPAETVLGLLAPAVESPIRSFSRIDLRPGGYAAVAPDCREDNVALVVDWGRSRPADNARLVAHGGARAWPQ